VVLDEADRMFEMGFEYQMLSIVRNIRPDRQILMFSATMKRRIESFARELFRNEVRIVVGRPGQANADIMQRVELVPDAAAKWQWLQRNIDEFAADGKVLIFVLSKQGTEDICTQLRNSFRTRQLAIGVDCLHGDKDQALRTKIMAQFSRDSERDNAITVLVATDIASRGLDVKEIRTVINFDIAKNIETYVHRIGRTGRMGIEGVTPGKGISYMVWYGVVWCGVLYGMRYVLVLTNSFIIFLH
jgi:ATP-dependent RNA helicase DDX42